MPTQSKALRASPVMNPMDVPRQSPPPNNGNGEESEDERQYMMLRHSDDEANGNGNDSSGGSNNQDGMLHQGGENNEPHHIPKSPDNRSGGAGGPRSFSMRGRGGIPGPAAGAAASVAAQYQQHHQPPVPFLVGGPPPGGPPSYNMRGVSEDANSPGYGAPYPPGAAPSYPPELHEGYDPAALSMAPSWGNIDLRQVGTFDYGDDAHHAPGEFHQGDFRHSPPGTNVITPAQTFRKQAQAQASHPSPGMTGYPGPGGMAGYPCQGMAVGYPAGYPGSAGPTNNYFMYPPSSPIKAGPSPKASPESSPKMDSHSPQMQQLLAPSPRQSPKVEPDDGEEVHSEEELAAEWLPPQSTNSRVRPSGREGNGRVMEPTAKVEPRPVHIPPKPPGVASISTAAASSEMSGVPRGAQPQFVRRQPSHAPGSDGPAAHSAAPPQDDSTPPRYRPPLVVDPSRSRSTDSSESPGTNLTYSGRIQVVGGQYGGEWHGSDGHPWNLVSRSRSMEENSGASNEWEPPQPTRQPMVPPPGRPAVASKSTSAPASTSGQQYGSMRPPPPPPSYYGYDYYGRPTKGGAPPAPSSGGPPGLGRSSSSHSSGGSSGYPGSYSPERPPPPPRSSSGAYAGYPPPGATQGGYPPYGYPGYHPSQYPYHPSYGPPRSAHPGAHPGYPPRGQEDENKEGEPAPHPLLKDYNPHRDSMITRPQFQNVKKTKAAAKRSATAMANHPLGPGASALGGAQGQGEAQVGPGGEIQTPRRRRRRNPTEKAAAAAAMAAAAEAALKERQEKMAAAREKAEKAKEAATGVSRGVTTRSGAAAVSGASGVAGVITSPFSEEELKTLGSGDDEDIPAVKRAAMASAVALRAAAGGSPLEPPKSAAEVDFDIADPSPTPICLPSTLPVLESATMMTENDVLCGRGGGTNSQMGNRRFRALVRDFQPTYLMAKRREKPKMARSVVLIVRHRTGRFLRRDEKDGRLYEVGDEKAEAKTSQALREGLDVRATKTAANTLMGTPEGSSGGGKKRKTSPRTTASVAVKSESNVLNGAMNIGMQQQGSTPRGVAVTVSSANRPQPVHAPGGYHGGQHPASRPSRPLPVASRGRTHPSARPSASAGYYHPYPRYDIPYCRSRYPPQHAPPTAPSHGPLTAAAVTAASAAYDYGHGRGHGHSPPTAHHAPPPPPTMHHHHHHHYATGRGGGYPQQYPAGYPAGYGAHPGAPRAPPNARGGASSGAYPSPPRSSHKPVSRPSSGEQGSSAHPPSAFSPPRSGPGVVSRHPKTVHP